MLGDVIELSVVVKDMDEAIERYTRLFGLKVHKRGESKEFGFLNAILPTGIGHIELLQPTDPSKAVGRPWIARALVARGFVKTTSEAFDLWLSPGRPGFVPREGAAAPDTVIRLPEVAMGLVPGAGGTASLPRRIGRERTAWLGLTGQPLGVSDALAWGLVDAIADPR